MNCYTPNWVLDALSTMPMILLLPFLQEAAAHRPAGDRYRLTASYGFLETTF